MTDAEKATQFRRAATRVFRVVVASLLVAAAGLAAVGWWVGRWWGLGAGLLLGLLLLAGGLAAAVMLYAMSQDGA